MDQLNNQISPPQHGFQGSRGQLLRLLGWLVHTGNPAATMDRLFKSQHVSDFRTIVSIALTILTISIVLCAFYAGEVAVGRLQDSDLQTDIETRRWLVGIVTFVTLSTTMFSVFGAICAWAYKSGSMRLGVVDLFACEIGTLCRVTTITNTVGRYIDRIEQASQRDNSLERAVEAPKSVIPRSSGPIVSDTASPPLVSQFRSEENYFPVFEGNTRDLQSLEARVVINITSFYTYMKAVRDFMRVAAALKPVPVSTAGVKTEVLNSNPWRDAMRDVVYMLFLGLEAGRCSINDLVEFEPEWAERTIIVLLSEMKAYSFLLKEFPDPTEIHALRLLLRKRSACHV